MRDALLLVDVLQDFRHEDADALLASFRERHGALVAARAGELVAAIAPGDDDRFVVKPR